MTSYFNACDVTVANSNHKICYNFFSTCICGPHFEKGSATHGHGPSPVLLLCDTVTIFVCIDKFSCHCVFISSNFY